MPIKLTCNCGHAFNVSSKFAGKTGKCPNCKNPIKVPTPPAAAPVANVPAAPAAAPMPAPAPGGHDPLAAAMGDVLDDAGLTQGSGPSCPKCYTDIPPGTVMCVSCGFNLQTGEQLLSHDVTVEQDEFQNMYLQQAADNIQREKVMETRHSKAAMPWWVIMSFFLGAVFLCAAGVIIVDGKFGVAEPDTSTMIGKIQNWPVFTTLGLTVLLTGLSIVVFANMSVMYFGFTQSALQGLACIFMPILASLFFGIKHWADNKAAVKAIILGLVICGCGAGLVGVGGGFGLVFDAFR